MDAPHPRPRGSASSLEMLAAVASASNTSSPQAVASLAASHSGSTEELGAALAVLRHTSGSQDASPITSRAGSRRLRGRRRTARTGSTKRARSADAPRRPEPEGANVSMMTPETRHAILDACRRKIQSTYGGSSAPPSTQPQPDTALSAMLAPVSQPAVPSPAWPIGPPMLLLPQPSAAGALHSIGLYSVGAGAVDGVMTPTYYTAYPPLQGPAPQRQPSTLMERMYAATGLSTITPLVVPSSPYPPAVQMVLTPAGSGSIAAPAPAAPPSAAGLRADCMSAPAVMSTPHASTGTLVPMLASDYASATSPSAAPQSQTDPRCVP